MPKGSKNLYEKVAGMLIVIASILFIFFVILAQSVYPNYSLNNNYISDLGVGITAPLFNSAAIFFGVMLLMASYLLHLSKKHPYLSYGFALVGVGAFGVGMLPESTGLPHLLAAFLTFGGAALTALGFSKASKGPLSYYSMLAGALGLLVLLITLINITGVYTISLGLGHGGIEEILFYDEIIWAMVFGVYLIRKNA